MIGELKIKEIFLVQALSLGPGSGQLKSGCRDLQASGRKRVAPRSSHTLRATEQASLSQLVESNIMVNFLSLVEIQPTGRGWLLLYVQEGNCLSMRYTTYLYQNGQDLLDILYI